MLLSERNRFVAASWCSRDDDKELASGYREIRAQSSPLPADSQIAR